MAETSKNVHDTGPVGPRVAFVMAELGSGGIGRITVLLTRELVSRGFRVDLVLGRVAGPFVEQLDPRVRVVSIKTTHSLGSIIPLALYVRRARPAAIVCEKLRVNLAVHRACALVRRTIPVFASIHGVLQHKLEGENLPDHKKRRKYRDIAKAYPRNAGFLPVSSGIGRDLIEHFGVPAERVHVVLNPVVTDAMLSSAREAVDHPWFADGESVPVIIGVGRLEPQKDFTTLIRAFALLRKRLPIRLLILGEGSERAPLASLVTELGLDDDVSMPGFVANPYAFVSRSAVFVLSSRWEGFGNVIVEAMALGTPVVSTDCPAGPREILDDGRFGRLVPIADSQAMADAIEATLAHPVPRELLVAEGAKYTPAAAVDGYLRAMQLDQPLADGPKPC